LRDDAEVQLCACSCGETTPLAVKTNKRYGHTKGRPVRFVRGHGRRLSGVPYLEQDMGYESVCWVWQRARTRTGYGQAFDGRMMRPAHRVYYDREYGKVSEGLILDHLCRVRACVNPAHLEPVTHAENVRRGKAIKVRGDCVAMVCEGQRVPDEPAARFEATHDRATRTVVEGSWQPGDELFVQMQGGRFRLLADDGESMPFGYCRCGCGNTTPLAIRNEYRRGHEKGKPIPVLHGHNRRVRPPHFRVVDAGYDSPCYLWNHGKTSDGYAQTSSGNSTKLVHRLVYDAVNGTLPKGLELHHACEHRDCIGQTT
jgi:HNH endonuclease